MILLKVLPAGFVATTVFLLSVGCKPTGESSASSANAIGRPTATPSHSNNAGEQAAPANQTRTGLTATQWLTKQKITDEEARTVDALLDIIPSMGGPQGSPQAKARWADRGLQILSLEGKNLSNISPILVFKNISTLHMSGNKLTQAQVDELIMGLPKLRNLVIDPGLNCAANIKVNCLH